MATDNLTSNETRSASHHALRRWTRFSAPMVSLLLMLAILAPLSGCKNHHEAEHLEGWAELPSTA